MTVAALVGGASLWMTIGAVVVDAAVIAGTALSISSTYLRNRAEMGQSLRYLTPDSVTGYIRKHRLYDVYNRHPFVED